MKTILIIDDDVNFCSALQSSLLKRSYIVQIAHHQVEALQLNELHQPQYILLDLRINVQGSVVQSGLELIPALLNHNETAKIVMLTGYADINTAVEAIKLGAIYYLTKPTSIDEILQAFVRETGNPNVPILTETQKLNEAERNHIISTFERCGRNVSKAARELGLHRRTLQRKLDKLKL
jgi:two-component system, response regulator RegA